MKDEWAVVLFFSKDGIDLEDVAFIKIPECYRQTPFSYAWDWGHKVLGVKVDFSAPCRVRAFTLDDLKTGERNDWAEWLDYSSKYSYACQTRRPNVAIEALHRD